MFKALKNLFDDNAKDIKKYEKKVAEINSFEPQLEKLSDEELQGKTAYFKEKLANGASLDDILTEAFAVVREASKRILKMRHFDVQLIGGMVLHDGRIAEMKTGEGKTLVATLPAYLNALTGKGVHVITVNDYLATRDSEWMGRLYNFLGLSVGLNLAGMDSEEKAAAYAADITYGTNNEFGFDYLRDNMAAQPEAVIQKQLNYAIVDEVDSILIDEARTPLIISGQAEKPSENYYTAASVVRGLEEGEEIKRDTTKGPLAIMDEQPEEPDCDYTVDEKLRAVALTARGIAKVEQKLGIDNLYDDENTEWSHLITQALRAKALFKRDRDYIVKDGEVLIVDEFTGRLMYGRRYSDGLHQALEAKEGVKIERESQTLATITFQNFFRMYSKISGMTGTAATEEAEFTKIYKMDVVVVPPNMPNAREDLPDSVYRSAEGKIAAIVEDIKEKHETGRPVLVGTVSIDKSERLHRELRKIGIPHNVLNAKFHEQEAEIIAQAGRYGTVTIATNMAGRGTDILLGGNPEFLVSGEMTRLNKAGKEGNYDELYAKFKAECDEEKEKIVALGGLYVIGTERHESRRIDNQLRGRSGRQGDPGTTRFFISLEDDLMRLFGGDNLGQLFDRFGVDDTMPIDSSLISKRIEGAQKKVETNHFEARKNVLDYDDVMNQQREVIYTQRRQVLLAEDIRPQFIEILHSYVEDIMAKAAKKSPHPEEWDLHEFNEDVQVFLPHGEPFTEETICRYSPEELKDLLIERADAYYKEREEEVTEEHMKNITRLTMLRVVDSQWMDHLDAMDQLRDGIGLRSIGHQNPLVAYKYEAYDMFNAMISDIRREMVRLVLRTRVIEQKVSSVKNIHTNKDDEGKVKTFVRKSAKIGRNEPCPCGSGKKYKNCCGK